MRELARDIRTARKRTAWMTISDGRYEVEYYVFGLTGWYRCVGGRLASGHWPEWNSYTGETR